MTRANPHSRAIQGDDRNRTGGAVRSSRDWRADPKRGDIIRAKRGYQVARRIITVGPDKVLTAGYSGNQRNRWMSKANLSNYDLVTRVEDDLYA